MAHHIRLKVLLPFCVLLDCPEVESLVAWTQAGSYGLYPRRRDCVTALAPGILSYRVRDQGEAYLALDEGILVKFGSQVLISVRNAAKGSHLGELKQSLESELMALDRADQAMRMALLKMESEMIRRMREFH